MNLYSFKQPVLNNDLRIDWNTAVRKRLLGTVGGQNKSSHHLQLEVDCLQLHLHKNTTPPYVILEMAPLVARHILLESSWWTPS